MSIKINIGSLREGTQRLQLETSSVELGIDQSAGGWHAKDNIQVQLDMFKTANQLDIRAEIKGVLELECDRCLDFYEKPIEQKLELVYVLRSPRTEPINDDYYRTYDPNMRTIDITNDIKEMVVLAVPMKRVPAEKNDGSCSWCGKTKEYWQQFIVDEEELEK